MIKISSVPQARRELSQTTLDLDALVVLVNELLPRFLPPESGDKALVSVRLARYFQTHGLLDEPFKIGREARYGARHLLQLLAVRRLMAQGYSTNSLSDLLKNASDDALQRLIEGETPSLEPQSAQSSESTTNAALDFLSEVRLRRAPSPSPTSPSPQAPVSSESNWTRIEIGRAIEVHLRDDFGVPQSPHEWDVLIEAFKTALQNGSSTSAKRRRR